MAGSRQPPDAGRALLDRDRLRQVARLVHVVTERDRLASLGDASAPRGNVRGTGLRGYLRSTVDRVIGVDEEQARIERMQRLDGRIDELEDAVSSAHEHSQAFNDHLMQEHKIFELGRQCETKQLLSSYVDGNLAMYRSGQDMFDRLIAQLE